MRIHHVGIACADIEEVNSEFSKYHKIIKQSDVVYDPQQKAQLCMVHSNIGLDVEFICGEQVAKIVKNEISYYHLCYEVDDLDSTIEQHMKLDAKLISEPKPAVLFDGRRVAFLYLSYGLVEFVETTK